MRKSRWLKSLLCGLLTTSLMPISTSAVAESRWIYPGQTLPADVPFVPLRADTDAGANVRVTARDWFLTKPAGLLLPPNSKNPNPIRNYSGPVLGDLNAQVYFRLVSGMVLKETMKQIGMKPGQALELLNRLKQNGKSIEDTPLDQVGNLPRGLDELYSSWGQPYHRTAVIPYLTFPLSVADSQSSFQHFYETRVVNNSASKNCSTITTVAPLGAIQAKIADRQNKLDQLDDNVRNANELLDQSSRTIAMMTNDANKKNQEIQDLTQCLNSIRARVTSGAAMPTPDCLGKAKSTLKPELTSQWTKFTAENLAQEKGDFTLKQEAEVIYQESQGKLDAAKTSLASMQDSRLKANSDLVQNQATLEKINTDQDTQKNRFDALTQETASLKKEFDQLEDIRIDLNKGTFGQNLPQAEVQKAISDPKRPQRAREIQTRLPQILEEQSKIQTAMSGETTQINWLNQKIETDKAQIAGFDKQIGDAQNGATKAVADLQQQTQKAFNKKIAAENANSTDELILTAVSDRISTMGHVVSEEFVALKRETSNGNNIKTSLATATKSKDTSWSTLNKELIDLRAQLANYISDSHMGWFLETDCATREQNDGGNTGIFVSRAQMSDKVSATNVADGGKWGMFNLDYTHFQTSIDGGILLSLTDYIHLSVQNLIGDLDFTIAQFQMAAVANRCKEMAGAAFSSGLPDIMGSAFSIWNEGNDDQAMGKSYCRSTYAPKMTYMTGLTTLINFDGSVLDQALPRTNSVAGNDQIERRAISALGKEMKILTGLTREDSSLQNVNARRDELIRSLIQVLAFDYDKALAQAQTMHAAKGELLLAGAAPGPTATADTVSKLGVGASVNIINSVQAATYNAPIATNETLAGHLQLNDQVVILPIEDGATDGVRAGWLRFQLVRPGSAVSGPYWASASEVIQATQAAPVVQQPVNLASTNASAKATTAPQDPKCPLRRLVAELRTPDHLSVARFIPELRLGRTPDGVWLILQQSQRTTPADVSKPYIACEIFSQPGKPAMVGLNAQSREINGLDYSQAIGVRIVEARKEVENGVTRYVPVEDVGGFVPTWFSVTRTPRITLGPQLNENWSPIP